MTTDSKRRRILKLATALAGLAAGAPLRAQDAAANWPAKNVRLIIPFTPGGSTDFQGRLLKDAEDAEREKAAVWERMRADLAALVQ